MKRFSLIVVVTLGSALAASAASAQGVGGTRPGIGNSAIHNGVGGGNAFGLDNAQDRANWHADKPFATIDGNSSPVAGEVHTSVIDNAEARANWHADKPTMNESVPGVGNRGNHYGQATHPNNGNHYGQTGTLPSRSNRFWPR